jgi:hypothetical protein
MRKPEMVLPLLIALSLGIDTAAAASPVQEKQAAQDMAQGNEPIFGSQLMTREEREKYRAEMRSLKTREECKAYRMGHKKIMQERAKKMGKTIPDVPER